MADIQPITSDQVDEAISVIAAAVHSVYGHGEPTPDRISAVRSKLISSGSLADMQDVPSHYDRNGGMFLVLVDSGSVVGTGALKRIDAETAELGRMWFLSSHRRRGLGRQMAERLLAFARDRGYQRVRLNTSEKCTNAIAWFRKLGFQDQDIDRYKRSPTTLFMELRLNNESR